MFFFFSSRRRHTRCSRDWSSDVCSSDLNSQRHRLQTFVHEQRRGKKCIHANGLPQWPREQAAVRVCKTQEAGHEDRKSTRLNSSHGYISYAVFCLKKKKK